jgi:hypothetical protein
MDLMEKYKEEIKDNLKLDEFNIKDISLKTPGLKHYWSGRLITHKKNLLNLEKEKDKILKKIKLEVQNQSPVRLSNGVTVAAANETDILKQLNLNIAEEKLIIEFLENTQKIFASLTYDIKNIIDILKLEQL